MAAKILDRRSTPNEELEDLAGWLETTAGRAGDPTYSADVLHHIGPKRIAEAVDVAVRAGPEARQRMCELIASASRSGTLDPKVEAALMRSPDLRLLAQSDAGYSDVFAAHMANTLLDPNRVTFDSDPMIPGPSQADLEAAHDLIERYGVGHLDDGHLAALMGNIYLPPGLVSDTIRLAVAGHKENATTRRPGRNSSSQPGPSSPNGSPPSPPSWGEPTPQIPT